MSAGQHTAGPWRAEADMRGDIDWNGKQRGPDYLAGWNVTTGADEIIGCEGIIPSDCAEANARLIAAAPDLLKALQRAEERDEARRPYDDVEMCADDGDVDSKDELWRRQKQRAAIARATGAA